MSSRIQNPADSRVAQSSLPLNEDDLRILRNVDESLAESLALKDWYSKKGSSGEKFLEQFDLIQSFNHPSRATGFFDKVPLNGKDTEIMGVVQEMLYDRADTGAMYFLETIRDELREFILQYFMRISDFRRPQAAVRPDAPPSGDSILSFLGWCPRNTPDWQGFGYSQHYYKLKDSGAVGKFAAEEIYAITDLRDLGEKFEWIVAKVRVFDFNLIFAPFGPNLPSFSFPLKEETYLILHRGFITDIKGSGEGTYGVYGFGYGILRMPDENSVLAYGPGHFGVGLQTINFQMLPSGETRVQLVFVVNRPERILNVPLDPVWWGFTLADALSLGAASQVFHSAKQALQRQSFSVGAFDPLLSYVWLANAFTGGEAGRQLCISKEQLEKEMLVQHFMQHYDMIVGSLLTWRQIPDWLDKKNLPAWVIHGVGV